MPQKLKVTLIKSMIGKPERQRRVLRSMGLTKLNRTVLLVDNPCVRGMVRAVSHMLKVEECKTE